MQGNGWRLVCFDLDGTLVRGTSVSQHLADRLGHGALLADLERRYAAQEITNATVADSQAKQFAGRGRREMMTHLDSPNRRDRSYARASPVHRYRVPSCIPSSWTISFFASWPAG